MGWGNLSKRAEKNSPRTASVAQWDGFSSHVFLCHISDFLCHISVLENPSRCLQNVIFLRVFVWLMYLCQQVLTLKFNSILDFFPNHDGRGLWPLPLPDAWQQPNQVHIRHPHTAFAALVVTALVIPIIALG
jgi:hypothetical protein